MSRLSGLFLSFSVIIGLQASSALALGPYGNPQSLGTAQQSPVINVRPLTERQKCMALNRCRQKYTHCYNKLERQHKIAQKDEVCVPPYQKCINETFSGMDWFFTRWFDPSYLDCRQYPN